MKEDAEITNEILDIVFFHFRETGNEEEAARKAGLDYHSYAFHDVMNHFEDRGVIEKTGNGPRVTLAGKQFKGFVKEAQELRKAREREEEKRNRDEERDNYDLLAKKFFYRWRWTPWVLSALALVVAVCSYFKK